MKTGILNLKFTSALVGLVLMLSSVVSANAQNQDFLTLDLNFEHTSKVKGMVPGWNDEEKEELQLIDVSIDIEEVATVTFINKWGEVVAVLTGDKSVLNDIYQDRMSKGDFLSSFGIHEVYLVR